MKGHWVGKIVRNHCLGDRYGLYFMTIFLLWSKVLDRWTKRLILKPFGPLLAVMPINIEILRRIMNMFEGEQMADNIISDIQVPLSKLD